MAAGAEPAIGYAGTLQPVVAMSEQERQAKRQGRLAKSMSKKGANAALKKTYALAKEQGIWSKLRSRLRQVKSAIKIGLRGMGVGVLVGESWDEVKERFYCWGWNIGRQSATQEGYPDPGLCPCPPECPH
jgi:hypothetical protein